MTLRRELVFAIGGLVALNVLLAFGSIGLLARMGPVIARILQENGSSIVAAEDILGELATATGTPLAAVGRARVVTAYERLERNLTEQDERSVVSAIGVHLERAMAGELEARRRVVDATREVIRLNREAMKRSDRDAQRLGGAGAWAAVLVGFLSFALSLGVIGRLRVRVLRPLAEVHGVLQAVRGGNHFRRCRSQEAPLELRQVASSVNELLDQRTASGARDKHDAERVRLERLALPAVLERLGHGAALVDERGGIICASDRILETLAGDEGPRLRKLLAEGPLPGGESVAIEHIPLGDGAGRLCVLRLAEPVASGSKAAAG